MALLQTAPSRFKTVLYLYETCLYMQVLFSFFKSILAEFKYTSLAIVITLIIYIMRADMKSVCCLKNEIVKKSNN